MALNIKDPEADCLARELARRTGESLTEAVVVALRERLKRETRREGSDLREELMAIARRGAARARRTDLTPEEIIGYDEHGVPT
jgi:antitoxin VapB